MSLAMLLNPLLAQGRNKWSDFSDQFRADRYEWSPESLLWWTLTLGGLAFGVWLLRQLVAWQSRARPVRPFKDLSQAHGLNRRQRALCREVTREHAWSDPAEVFVRAVAQAPLAEKDPVLSRRLFAADE